MQGLVSNRKFNLTPISPVHFAGEPISFWQSSHICGILTLSVERTSTFTVGEGAVAPAFYLWEQLENGWKTSKIKGELMAFRISFHESEGDIELDDKKDSCRFNA